MSDAIGAMRARVLLQSPVRGADNIGGATIGWADEGEAWALVSARGASQSARYDTTPSTSGYAVSINRRTDVRSGWRLVWGARTLTVTGVRDEGRARIELICEEETL